MGSFGHKAHIMGCKHVNLAWWDPACRNLLTFFHKRADVQVKAAFQINSLYKKCTGFTSPVIPRIVCALRADSFLSWGIQLGLQCGLLAKSQHSRVLSVMASCSHKVLFPALGECQRVEPGNRWRCGSRRGILL